MSRLLLPEQIAVIATGAPGFAAGVRIFETCSQSMNSSMQVGLNVQTSPSPNRKLPDLFVCGG
jgi:hypothetical protein